jgi:hypothetical protein
MDGHEFDDLVRRLSVARLTRVSVLRGLAAGALAGVIGPKAGAAQVTSEEPGCRGEGTICEGGQRFCCAGLVCNGFENPTRCRLCGALNQLCCEGGLCNAGLTCVNNTCVPAAPGGGGGGGGAVSPPAAAAAFRCTSDAQCSAQNGSAAPFCNTSTGVCFAVRGLNCKSGETPQHCCNRSVRRGCNRKQQTSHARRNYLQRGKRRCKKLLSGA